MANRALESLTKELPNVLIAAILLVILLIVLTKFQWINCSQVPGNWCQIYCDYVEQSHSRIGIVYGDDGIGNEQELYQFLRTVRPNSVVQLYHINTTSQGLLSDFDAVIFMKAKTISSRQVLTINDYVSRGGTIVWIGDSGTQHYVDDFDLITAREQNASFYEQLLIENISIGSLEYQSRLAEAKQQQWYALLYNQSLIQGFDALEPIVAAKFIRVKDASGVVELRGILRNHAIYNGLSVNVSFNSPKYALVKQDDSRVTLIADLKDGNEFYPAVFESRYAGKIIYFAVPLEQIRSPALVNNLFDYLVTC
ncbi:hypothetical protein HUU53_01360 [Candidatus Micrarchaeota archaeon]|nr:hypothetical protein [Candidatus Micrarchaeota archaeon]